MSKNLRESRRNFLNLTITEIILTLLFLLMLVTGYLIKKNNELEKETQEFKSALDHYKKEGLDKAQIAQLLKLNLAIQKFKDGKGEYSVSELSEILNEVVLSKEAIKKLGEAEKELAQLKELNQKISKERAFYKGKYEKTGNDKPPCWPRKNDPLNADYLYEADINSKGIILSNTNNKYPFRSQERVALPISMVKEKVVLTPREFLEQTTEIKKLSDKLECRHYISVYDKSANDKDHWKKMIKAIESNFYIYENK